MNQQSPFRTTSNNEHMDKLSAKLNLITQLLDRAKFEPFLPEDLIGCKIAILSQPIEERKEEKKKIVKVKKNEDTSHLIVTTILSVSLFSNEENNEPYVVVDLSVMDDDVDNFYLIVYKDGTITLNSTDEEIIEDVLALKIFA